MISSEQNDDVDDSPIGFLDGEDLAGADDELGDCFLSEKELEAFLSPPLEKWSNISSNEFPTLVTINSAKEIQWKLAKREISHVREKVSSLLDANFDDVTFKDIVLLALGPESKIGICLKKELDLSDEEYLLFFSTMTIQSAYRISSTQLYDECSLLKDKVSMSQEAYHEVWRRLAERKQLPKSQIQTSRRAPPTWQLLEGHVNEFLRSISVTGREGEVAIALDDDKVWLSQTKSKSTDLFNLKYTTHVQPNRKGIVGHTAVSTGANIPLGIVFEKTFDTTLSCFQRLVNFLFQTDSDSRDGNGLRNVTIHSDRGYLVPQLVFEYLLQNGAQVVGTVKRMAGCWPFTYSLLNKPKESSDKRTSIDAKGAPTLYIKWTKAGAKKLYASAFRNGSEGVATAISSLHPHHQWEGIVLKHAELQGYKRNKKELIPSFFQRIDELFAEDESIEERAMMNSLLENQILPCTLRQGTTSSFHFVVVSFPFSSHTSHLCFAIKY